MKRLIFAIMLLAAIAVPACAQTPTVTTPQSVTAANFFNGVSTAQVSSSFTNLGQTVHSLFYLAGGSTANPTGVQIRLEGSFDGITYFPISDDGSEPGQSGTGMVLAIGSFPFIRANLLKCTGCDALNTISASYTGTSSIPGNPFGTYGAGQQIRKVVFVNISAGTTANATPFNTPYGSLAGFILVNSTGAFDTNASITVRCQGFVGTTNEQVFFLPTSGAATIAIPVAATPCPAASVRFFRGNTGVAQTFSAAYFLYPPGEAQPAGAQPAFTQNSESTSAANAAVSATLTVNAYQRGSLFKLNARCSAGTAQITVADGATQIYSTGATEVGTTSFKDSWPVGLASTAGNNLVITLGTCGAANTGTLDVQGSVF